MWVSLFLCIILHKMLIGVAGPKNSGKDTFASVFSSYFNETFAIRPFAEPLKRICQQMYLLSDEQLHDRQEKEKEDPRWKLSPRQMFQMFGTDYIRKQIDPNFWVKHFELWYQAQPQGTNVLVPDIRFQNELDLIHQLGGKVVFIDRPDAQPEEQAKHECEVSACQLQNIDFVVHNAGSLLEYYEAIAKTQEQYSNALI